MLVQTTFHCNDSPVILSIDLATTQYNPQYCPCCNAKHKTSTTDGWDYYALSLKMPRPMSKHLLTTLPSQINNTLSQYAKTPNSNNLTLRKGVTQHHPQYSAPIYPPNQFRKLSRVDIAELTIQTMPTHKHITTNTCCSHCGSAFTIESHSIPEYCPFCGSKTLTHLTANSQPEFASQYWHHLANLYNISFDVIMAYHRTWRYTFANYRTFKEFMEEAPSRIKTELNSPQALLKTARKTRTFTIRVKAR